MDQAARLRSLAARENVSQRRPSGGRVIAVTSGKGGVGKTYLTVNLAIALAQKGLRIGILDGDFGLANVDILFGVTPRYTLDDLVLGKRSHDEITVTGPFGVQLYPGASGSDTLANPSHQTLSRLVAITEQLSDGLDILFIDTSAGLGYSVVSMLQAAHELILVTTPEPTSITDAYALVKRLSGQASGESLHLVVNKVKSPAEAQRACGSLNAVLKRYADHPVHLELLGHLPFDHAVPRAVIDQVPYILSHPAGSPARSLHSMADQLSGSPPVGSRDIGSLFRKLARRFR